GHPAGYTAYCASKSAIDGITKALGCEWGDTGITVNAIAPTVFRSPLTAWMYEDNERSTTVRKGFIARVPKGRLGEPSDLTVQPRLADNAHARQAALPGRRRARGRARAAVCRPRRSGEGR